MVFVLDKFYKIYGLEEIISATNNFSDENLIAKDAFGKVYKGPSLRYGNLMNFVVRRLDCEYRQLDHGLEVEISRLKSLEHNNIVTIFGHCDENNEKAIIYGHAIRGTLDNHLSDPTLTWSQRLRICLGVARALNYIHYDVIHCDINSSKIFLDEDWEPKIYGFELSSEYPQSWMHRLRFSRHLDTKNMTPKNDVQSFGVLLCEVLSGRKLEIKKHAPREDLELPESTTFLNQMDTECLKRLKTLVKCLNQQPVQLPTMDKIVKELEEVLELQSKYQSTEHPIAADEGTSLNNLKGYG